MKSIFLPLLEFYITNVCNLTCEHCRSFNNFKFTGFYEYNQENIDKWAEKIDIKHYSVIGGEPTLHPRLEQWLRGLRQAWPNSVAELITNGTHLSKVKNLHHMLAEYDYELQISIHGHNLRELIAKEIFLAFGECEIKAIESNRLWLRTKKGVKIDLQNGEFFQEGIFTNGELKLYDSDPNKAFRNCLKSCNHMIGDKIYKCAVLGLLPEFLRQQGKTVTHSLSYQGVDVDAFDRETLHHLSNPVPHCSICPESPKFVKMDSVEKKKNMWLKRIS